MTGKMREEFEAWMHDTAKIALGSGDPYPAGLERDYWRVWQASRAALVIELPPHDCDPGWNAAVRDCRIAIEKVGIKIKS